MVLTDEQSKQVKAQLLQQIKTTLPAEQQESASKYIDAMNSKELEEFLIKNKLIKTQAQPAKGKTKPKKQQECVFCAIANKQMPALPIYEDKDFLAVLEIKPFSKGHTILIPKKHIKKTKSLPSKAFTAANRIGKHVVKKLKAQSFQVTTAADMEHAIINIIPTYKKQPLTYERKPIDQKELQELAMKIGEVKKRVVGKKKTAKPKDILEAKQVKDTVIKLPRRIP